MVFLRPYTACTSSSRTQAVPPRFKQVVVALSNEVSVHIALSEAAIYMTWTHIEALTLALLPVVESDTPTCASRNFRVPLMTFILSFPVLTELNLSSFHFSGGIDCCHILAALTVRLRALSLAPCGINRKTSFINLAKVSSKLEKLDVRMNPDNVSSHCASCSQPFRAREHDAAILQQGSTLRRFTLCGVLNVYSLDFIASPRPSEIRNHTLFRGLEFYQQNLDALSHLIHLSLDVRGDNIVRTLTWFRQPDWHRETHREGRNRGALLMDRPCIGCSMATFTGLAKPRHHRKNCL
ncbi:uncharacterized protein LOC144159982 [Haemaphysalis longicornis]